MLEPFGKSHDRSAFSCEKSSFDDLLWLRVSQYEKRRLGKLFVAVLEGEKRAMGHYTLAARAVAFEHLLHEAATALPQHPIPLILLARLAFDQSAQGTGTGRKKYCQTPSNAHWSSRTTWGRTRWK
jgi:hypothetical protein